MRGQNDGPDWGRVLYYRLGWGRKPAVHGFMSSNRESDSIIGSIMELVVFLLKRKKDLKGDVREKRQWT